MRVSRGDTVLQLAELAQSVTCALASWMRTPDVPLLAIRIASIPTAARVGRIVAKPDSANLQETN